MPLSFRFLRDTIDIATALIDRAVLALECVDAEPEPPILDMVQEEEVVLDWAQRVVQVLRVLRGVLQNELDILNDENSLFDPEVGF